MVVTKELPVSKSRFLRSCIVCRTRDSKSKLIRLRISENRAQSTEIDCGRGYWVHADASTCLDPTRIMYALSKRGIKVTEVVTC
ncbi:hypothetical protein AXFE_00170 [Acidithrix ferrooxidans]|uniref:YlxR domain-containing protein n=1 Tax=Acidithrix ferrooxidans TaxID=1280514 RepID=A0A0D8HLV8_9ACTN|nr:hypothetical protein AXFE_00170 [Acidithrix ferrooxidans]